MQTGIGSRIVADIHGQSRWLMGALESSSFPIIFLGDLIDRGPDSAGALRLALDEIESGRARLVRSNHDDKLYRVLTGGQPRIGRDLAATLSAIDAQSDADALKARFVGAYAEAPFWLTVNQYILIHGAFAPAMLEFPDLAAVEPKALRDRVRYLALFAEGRMVEGERFPIRTYGWIENIPNGWTAIVGHDVRSTEAPMTVTNAAGGRAIFLDTGAGTGGHLSWIDLPSEVIGSVGL